MLPECFSNYLCPHFESLRTGQVGNPLIIELLTFSNVDPTTNRVNQATLVQVHHTFCHLKCASLPIQLLQIQFCIFKAHLSCVILSPSLVENDPDDDAWVVEPAQMELETTKMTTTRTTTATRTKTSTRTRTMYPWQRQQQQQLQQLLIYYLCPIHPRISSSNWFCASSSSGMLVV